MAFSVRMSCLMLRRLTALVFFARCGSLAAAIDAGDHEAARIFRRFDMSIASAREELATIEGRWKIPDYALFLQSTYMSDTSWNMMKLRFMDKIIAANVLSPSNAVAPFVIAFLGSSVTAGHDSLFNASFPVLIGQHLERALAEANLRLESRNDGIGNNPCAPYAACVKTFAGTEPDIIHWEQTYDCFHSQGWCYERFIREATLLPQLPLIVFDSSGTGHWDNTSCAPEEVSKEICEKEKQLLGDYLTGTALLEQLHGPVTAVPIHGENEFGMISFVGNHSSYRDESIGASVGMRRIVSDRNIIHRTHWYTLMETEVHYQGVGAQTFLHDFQQAHYACKGPYVSKWRSGNLAWHPSKLGHEMRAAHIALAWLHCWIDAVEEVKAKLFLLLKDKQTQTMLEDAASAAVAAHEDEEEDSQRQQQIAERLQLEALPTVPVEYSALEVSHVNKVWRQPFKLAGGAGSHHLTAAMESLDDVFPHAHYLYALLREQYESFYKKSSSIPAVGSRGAKAFKQSEPPVFEDNVQCFSDFEPRGVHISMKRNIVNAEQARLLSRVSPSFSTAAHGAHGAHGTGHAHRRNAHPAVRSHGSSSRRRRRTTVDHTIDHGQGKEKPEEEVEVYQQRGKTSAASRRLDTSDAVTSSAARSPASEMSMGDVLYGSERENGVSSRDHLILLPFSRFYYSNPHSADGMISIGGGSLKSLIVAREKSGLEGWQLLIYEDLLNDWIVPMAKAKGYLDYKYVYSAEPDAGALALRIIPRKAGRVIMCRPRGAIGTDGPPVGYTLLTGPSKPDVFLNLNFEVKTDFSSSDDISTVFHQESAIRMDILELNDVDLKYCVELRPNVTESAEAVKNVLRAFDGKWPWLAKQDTGNDLSGDREPLVPAGTHILTIVPRGPEKFLFSHILTQ